MKLPSTIEVLIQAGSYEEVSTGTLGGRAFRHVWAPLGPDFDLVLWVTDSGYAVVEWLREGTLLQTTDLGAALEAFREAALRVQETRDESG
jgi:hypothetical protein